MPDKHDAPWRGNVTPEGNDEKRFREEVRNILDLSHMTRDEGIFAELRRLKAQDTKLAQLEQQMDMQLRVTGAKS